MTIRKELILLKLKLEAEGHPNALNEARTQINLKYGKGWRDKESIERFNKSKETIKMSYY